MDTKTIIRPRGKWFVKDGVKIEDKYLVKYMKKNPDKLREKWNIYPAREIDKRQSGYWVVTKTTYDIRGGEVIIQNRYKQKFTMGELQQQRIEEATDQFAQYWQDYSAKFQARVEFENDLKPLPDDFLLQLKTQYDAIVEDIKGRNYNDLANYHFNIEEPK
jgi:hypothetical protein